MFIKVSPLMHLNFFPTTLHLQSSEVGIRIRVSGNHFWKEYKFDKYDNQPHQLLRFKINVSHHFKQHNRSLTIEAIDANREIALISTSVITIGEEFNILRMKLLGEVVLEMDNFFFIYFRNIKLMA